MAFGVDATSHATALTATTTGASVGITWNHTCGVGANKLVVTVGSGSSGGLDARSVASVTYNGVALTQVVEQDDGNFEHSEIWRLNSPQTGSALAILVKTVADTGNGCQLAVGAISFNDAAATEGTPNGATGTSANPSVTVDSAAGDICVDAYASDLGPTGTSTETGTLIWEDEDVNADSDFGSQRITASGASTAMTWTAAGGDLWTLCAVAIKNGGPVVATPIPFRGSFGRSRTRYAM